MELPSHSHQDIHPSASLSSCEQALRKRMGNRGFNSRMAIERHLNPANSTFFRKLVNRLMHRFFKITLDLSLTVIGQRRRAIENCWNTQIIRNTFSLEQFPSNQSLRILHLSDFHLDTRLDQAGKWAAMIEKLEYDFAVITGDFLNGWRLPNSETQKALQSVIGTIRKPVYGILGNHDCLLITRFLEEMGVTMLLNESVETDVRGMKLLVTGLDDAHLFQADDLDFATRTLKPNPDRYALSLVLAHAPKKIRSLAEAGYDICLSGHTHGGQLCTSQGLPLLRNGLYHADTIAGRWKMETLQGYTSRGTGTGKLTYRLNCQPEIVLHEIRHR